MSTIGHNGSPEESERPGNWFAVSRDIFDHPIIGIHDRPFTETEAWLWLLASASYETRRAMNKGTVIILDPGDLMAAHPYLGARWKWHVSKVRRFLDRLSNEAMITRFCDRQTGSQRNNQIQVITICNYSRYQIIKEAQEQASRHTNRQPSDSRATAERQPSDSNITSITAEPPNNIPSDLQSEGDRDNNSSRAKSARAGSGKGNRNFIRSSWLPADKPDGSQGLLFENGRLTVVNGCRLSLQQDFPDIDIDGACNKAAAEIVATQRKERCELSHMDCLTILRKHCQWEKDYLKKTASQSFGKQPGKKDFLSGLTPEQRALVEAQRSAKQGAH